MTQPTESLLHPRIGELTPRRIVIRVDGNETIGMGHVLRCLSLGQVLRTEKDMEVEFVTKADRTSLDSIRRLGFPIVPLGRDISWEKEVKELREIVVHRAASCVVTDLRRIESGYLASLKTTGVLVAVIDEWGDKEIQADLLFNGTVVAQWHRYQVEPSVACYLGPEYALLDPSFAQAHLLEREIAESPSKILIALGGDDPFHLTVKVMESLENIPGLLSVTAIIGPAFIDEEEIHRFARRSRHRYTLLKNARNMAELMCQADGAVTGGGLTALEVACTGTPAVIVCEVDHQVDTANVLEAQGAAVNLGLGSGVTHDFIAKQVETLLADREFRLRLSRAGKRVIDGQGTRRVVEILVDAMASRRR